jgi:hypothetical protein
MSDSEGQVSEVQRLDPDEQDTPISPEDSTAGYPESESGQPDTRGSGPDAKPPENKRDSEVKPGRHRRHKLGERIDDSSY